MASTSQLDREIMRIRIAMMAMLGALLFLGAFICKIQVFSSSKYHERLDKQSVRRVRLPAVRGAILERNGIGMAQNRPSYNIAIYVEELRKSGKMANTVNEVERIIRKVGGIIGSKPQVSHNDIVTHVRKRLPLPFLAWKDVDQKTLARWYESNVTVPGVDIYVQPVRFYPMGSLAAHVLGYVGRATPQDDPEDLPYHFYLPDMQGMYGVEKTFNYRLSGEAGGRLIRVDASGFRYDEMADREPRSGEDVTLTIDFRIQRLLEEVLGEDRGAGVVLDPRNGEILAMASAPSFDPNKFGSGISHEEYAELREGKAMLNRSIQEIYAPGSTFKPIVALAAVDGGIADEGTSFGCDGSFRIGSATFRCWQPSGHGRIALRKGIEQSCNCYFCQLGLLGGPDRIVKLAKEMGLGTRTGLDLGSESRLEASGNVPDREWKRRVMRDGWWPGDTCNISIGQGALAATPLQMAVMTAAIANGGSIYVPHVLLTAGRKPEPVRKVNISERAFKIVRQGMHDVIEAETGTGKRAKVNGFEMAGKTGTAEFGIKSEGKKYTWMTVFAPFDNPRYAVAMVIEEGVSGGMTVAPRINRLMEGVHNIEVNRLPLQGGPG